MLHFPGLNIIGYYLGVLEGHLSRTAIANYAERDH